ncbi:MAG: glycosyltransferase family 2 protein, partial [Verrucomicrobiota bacterium]
MSMSGLSIIIPTWNEEASLPATLEALKESSELFEVIVIDAGSADQTCDLARAGGARVIEATRKQKAVQLNQGARLAAGNVLLFLHADTVISASALANLRSALASEKVVGGGCARFFDKRSIWLRFCCHLATWRGKIAGLYLGDQAIFVRRSAFEKIGGFRELDVFEDYDLCRRLKPHGRLALI